METIVAVFDSVSQADIAEGDLQANGISRNFIRRIAPVADQPVAKAVPDDGNLDDGAERAGGFYEWLLGSHESETADDNHQRNIYEQFVGSGYTVLSVDITDALQGVTVMKILEDHTPAEIRSRRQT